MDMAQDDDVKTFTVALVGFVGAIVLVAIVFLLQVVYYRMAADQFKQKDLERPLTELQGALSAQQAKLTQYRWVDQAKGVVAIPIDRAMDLVVREMAPGPVPQAQHGIARPNPPADQPPPGSPRATGDTSHAKPK
jgi:hypothetical protein